MIGPISTNNIQPPHFTAGVEPVGLQPALAGVAKSVDVSAVKPMFANAMLLAPMLANISRMEAEEKKVQQTDSAQKAEQNLPNAMQPCRQFLASLQHLRGELNDLKEKGVMLGKNAELKHTGFAQIPLGTTIQFNSK